MNDTTLQRELATFRSRLPELLQEEEGRYALVYRSSIDSTWDTYEDALQAGYLHFGLKPFLVQKIERVETVHRFSRDLAGV